MYLWVYVLTCLNQVLFYEDPAPLKPLEEKWPMLIDKFPECKLS